MDPRLFLRAVIPSDLLCNKCTKVMKDPHQCLKCLKWACVDCSSYMKNHDHKCEHQFSNKNKFMLEKIESLYLRCMLYENGCDYFSNPSKTLAHEQTCDFAKKECLNTKCKSSGKHQVECDFFVLYCQNGCKKSLRKFEVYFNKSVS